jgi:cobalt-zinc-cadmium efflux system protein
VGHHGHGHAHGHGRGDRPVRGAEQAASPARLAWAIVLNAGLGIVQVIVGVVVTSVAVLADAGHQAVDAAGLGVALVAVRLVARPATARRTFGWARVDALGAVLSGLVLIATMAWVAVEAVRRLVHPDHVGGWGVLVIGLVGVVVNGLSIVVVGRHDEQLSLRAARLHLVTDLAGSLAVAVTGALVLGVGWERADPVISLLLVALVVRSCWQLLGSAGDVLLDRSPAHIDVAQLEAAVRGHDGVLDVHHLHVWSLGGGETAVSAHVVIDGEHTVHHAQAHLASLESMLATRFGIDHVTLQVECHECATPAHR